jgi:hypothetical protein
MPDVLRQQIAKTRGDLTTDNLLAQLAQEFGHATGLHGALRDALGGYSEETGRWERAKPDPALIQTTAEAHDRGALLVAAVFEAFVSIYQARIADLLRIATGGTGVLPAGSLHPDLVVRLAQEAAKAAEHILNMCIRALDYMPPVDPTFGDYLRAIITADHDLVCDDDLGYRLAVIEAFRHYGIYPLDLRSLAVDNLRWHAPLDRAFRPVALPAIAAMGGFFHSQVRAVDRKALFIRQAAARAAIHDALAKDLANAAACGLDTERLLSGGKPVFEVHSARPAQRIGPDGQSLADAVIELTQRRPGYFDRQDQTQADATGGSRPDRPPDFWFRGGSTLVVDLKTGELRYAITKNVWSEARLARQRDYLQAQTDDSLRAMYFGRSTIQVQEPFAFLHRGSRR